MSIGLGRGLDALLPADLQSAGIDMDIRKDQILTVPIDTLVPNAQQPRKTMTQDGLEELAKSIQAQGVLQPLLVRGIQESGKYQIVAGERRWRAAKMAHLTEIPVYVKDLSDEDVMFMALIENLQREDLNPAEEALALQDLKERLNLTQDDMARRLGKSRSRIANTLRLLQLPKAVLEMVQSGQLSQGHARSLLPMVEDEALVTRFATYVLEHAINVRDCEDMVAQWKKDGQLPWDDSQPPAEVPAAAPAPRVRRSKSPEFKQIEKDLSKRFALKARLNGTAEAGRVSIVYKNAEELQRLLQSLGVEASIQPGADAENAAPNQPAEAVAPADLDTAPAEGQEQTPEAADQNQATSGDNSQA